MLIIVCGLFVVTANAQKVEVDESFITDANKAFDLVIAQRKLIEDFQRERAKTDSERIAAQTLIDSFDALIKVKDQISSEKDKIIALYEKVIQLQTQLIDKLQAQLLKPKSPFEKFLKGIKETLILVAGVALGRGL